MNGERGERKGERIEGRRDEKRGEMRREGNIPASRRIEAELSSGWCSSCLRKHFHLQDRLNITVQQEEQHDSQTQFIIIGSRHRSGLTVCVSLTFLLDVDAGHQEGLREDYRAQVSFPPLEVWDVEH